MVTFLRPNLYAAIWGRDLIFLDAERGAYQLMAGAAHVAHVTAHGARLWSSDPEFLAFLQSEGMIGADLPADSTPQGPPPYPARSALGAATADTKGHRRAIARAYAEMALLYVGRPLPFLLAHARSQPSGSRASDPVELARAFEAASPWLPWQGACVFRSFMLMRLLSRAGVHDLHWVFGVKTWPFSAHCWVQQGDVVLSDYAENLPRFSPIFAA
jgi:hypothetical protein